MVARLYAGAARLPFMHLRSNAGSDLPAANGLIRTVTCPYTGEELSTVPALRPDVAIVHAQRADAKGNAHIWGIVGRAERGCFAAERVILTCEELVTAEQIASDPNRTLIPAMVVDAVVHEPWCCHPNPADQIIFFYLVRRQKVRSPAHCFKSCSQKPSHSGSSRPFDDRIYRLQSADDLTVL